MGSLVQRQLKIFFFFFGSNIHSFIIQNKQSYSIRGGEFTNKRRADLAKPSAHTFEARGIKAKEIDKRELLKTRMSWRIPWSSVTEESVVSREMRLLESERHLRLRKPKWIAAEIAVFSARASAIRTDLT